MDPSNYPDSTAYLEKVKQYTRDFPVTRSHDLYAGTSYMVSIFTCIPILVIVILGVFSFGIVQSLLWIFGGWWFFFIITLALASPSIEWLVTPLYWMPRGASLSDVIKSINELSDTIDKNKKENKE